MTNNDIVIRVWYAFQRPYPLVVGDAVLVPPRARLRRQVRLYLTPSAFRTLTLESEVTASRFGPMGTLRGFSYSGEVIDPAEIPPGALLTTMSHEEAARYAEQVEGATGAVRPVVAQNPGASGPGA